MWLHIDGRVYDIGQLGPGFAMLGKAESIEGKVGELERVVDGESKRWPIRITGEINGDSRRFEFESLDT